MANLAIFKHLKLYKKKLEVKYLFEFELRMSVSSMGYEKFMLKTINSTGEY